jgi:hypothetical protein
LKEGQGNFPRGITDFAKLAISHKGTDNEYLRWTLVAWHSKAKLSTWLEDLVQGKKRHFVINRVDDQKIVRIDDVSSELLTKDESSSIFNKLNAYEISTLSLNVKQPIKLFLVAQTKSLF